MATMKSVRSQAAAMGLDVVKYNGNGGGYSIVDAGKQWQGSNWTKTLSQMEQKLTAARQTENGWQMCYY